MADDTDTETASQIAELEATLVRLKKMRNSGVFSVRHGDTSTQFRSLSELNKAIAAVQSELRLLKGEKRAPSYVLQRRKGL